MLSEANPVGAMRYRASLAGTCLRALLACALALTGSAQVAGAAPASFSPLPLPTACTEPVQPALLKGKSSSSPVRILGLAGSVYTAELAGSYDRGQPAPRAALAARLIETAGEDVDFIVVFTSFEFPTGDALAFYNPIRNDVRGIGLPIFDHSELFGSPGRLQGYVDMAAVDRYSLNTRDPAYRTTLNVLSHELMHRWGVSVRYRSADGQTHSDLIGREGSHWSLLADTQASVMYGGDWRQESDGGFRLSEAMQRFSRWDLYLAGLAAPEEVPDVRLLRNTGLDPNALPLVGTRTSGTVERVALSQVIAAEGERRPSATEAQREFSAALVLLVRPGETVEPAKLAQLQRLAQRYEPYFQSITEGRASLRFISSRRGEFRTGAPEVLSGSPLQRHADPVAAALTWLKARQLPSGGFADRPSTAVRDSAAALRTLLQVEPAWSGAAAVRASLTQAQTANADDRLRRASAVGVSQPQSPGPALVGGWVDGVFDLALSAALDADSTLFDAEVRARLLTQLLGQQAAQGGFASVSNGAARLRASLLAAQALLAQWPEGHAGADRARAWLLNHLLDLPLQGAQSAGTSELADALVLAGELRLPETLRLRLSAALQSRQGRDGDWEGSVYTTAVAAFALARLTQPDLQVLSVSIAPEAPRPGEPLQLRARVRNAGGVATPAQSLRWSREQSAQPGTFDALFTRSLPPLIPGETATVEASVETQAWAALTRLRLQLDPDNTLVEVSEANNEAEISVQFVAAGGGADAALVAGEHVFAPERFQRLGDRVTLSGQVRNLGAAPAQQIQLRLQRVLGTSREPLAETRLDLPANGRTPYSLAFDVSRVGEHDLELVVDPLQQSEDARRENNLLRLQLPAAPGVDLEIRADSLQLSPNPPRIGADQRVRIRSVNRGNSLSDQVSIELRRQTASGVEVLQRRPLQLQAGGEAATEFSWRPDQAGVQRMQVVIDPDQQLAEIAEDNNRLEFEVEPVRSDGPDLRVVPGSTVAVPAQPLQGRRLRVDARVINQGQQPASAYRMAVFLGDPRSGGELLAASAGPDLAAGGSAEISLAVEAFPARGDVSLFLMADSELVIAEDSEDNNLGVIDTIAVAMPDAALTAESVLLDPPTPLPGLPVSLRARVSNIGEQPTDAVQATLAGVWRGDVRGIAQALEVPQLAPGAVFELQWQWTSEAELPDALLIQLDAGGSSLDGDRANNEVRIPLLADRDRAFALVPYFSPDGNGVRDRASAVFPAPAERLRHIEVLDVDERLVASLSNPEALPGGRSLVTWDGIDSRGRVAPDGSYLLVARDADQRTLGRVWLVLDADRPMALSSVVGGEVLSRRLPASVNEWLAAPDGSPAEDYLYTWGNDSNSLTALKRGIARTHALFSGVEPVVSARWLDRHADGAAVSSLMIEPSLGRELVFIANGRVWAQPLGELDQAELIAELPSGARDASIVGFTGPSQIVLQQTDGPSHVVVQVDLDAGQTRILSEWGQSFVIQTSPAGVLLGQSNPFVLGDVLPTAFLPADFGSSAVALNLLNAVDPSCFARFETAGEHPALFWHVLGTSGEQVLWINLLNGESRTVFEAGPGGCPQTFGSASNPKLTHRSPLAGFAQARVVWIESRQAAVLIDHAQNRVQELNPTGVVLRQQPFASPARRGDYAQREGVGAFRAVVRGEAVGESAACPVRMIPELGSASGVTGRGRAEFAPWAEELYFATGEVVLDRPLPEDNGSQGSPSYGYACAGAVDYLAFSLRTGEFRPIASRSGWALQEAEDRARYQQVGVSAPGLSLPPEWPRFIQSSGVRTRVDARIAAGASGDGRFWAPAARLWRSLHAESRLLLNAATTPERPVTVITSLDRLRSELRAASNGRSVTLFGFATDANLDYYQLDYARADAPESWLSIVPARREQVRGDEILTWAPPQSGAYLFRLRVVDRAGNQRDSFASAELVFSSPVSNVRADHRAISPNGDGVKDALRLDFTVSRPTELRVRVLTLAGEPVRVVDFSYGAADLGAQHWIWDGRDEQGRTAADGFYRVELSAGFALPVKVDTVFPDIDAASFSPTYPPKAPTAHIQFPEDSLQPVLEFRARGQVDWRLHGSSYSPEITGARLQWLELFAGDYRWALEDAAGNRTLRQLAPASPALILLGAETTETTHESSWQPSPFRATRWVDIPEHRATYGVAPKAVTVLLPGVGRPVYFLADYEEPRPVVLDIARSAGASMDEQGQALPLRWQSQPEVLPTALGDGWFRIDADFSMLDWAEIVALRVRERSGEQLRLSNAMRFNSSEPNLSGCYRGGWNFSVLLPARSLRAELSFAATGTSGAVTRIEGQRLPDSPEGREQWHFPPVPNPDVVGVTVRVWTSESARPIEYSGGQPCPAGGPGGGGPGLRVALGVGPDSSGLCNAEPSGRVRAWAEVGSQAQAFRIELRDPRQAAPVQIASVEGHRSDPLGYPVDMTGLPGMEGGLSLLIGRANAYEPLARSSFPIDRTALELGFTSPAPGTRVCATTGSSAGLDAFVNTDTFSFWGLEAASLSSAEPRYQWLNCNGSTSPEAAKVCEVLNHRPLTQPLDLNQRSLSGQLLALSDPRLPDGEVSFRLRGLDWSGAQACATTTVLVDASVQVDERLPPSPAAQGAEPPTISHRGSPEFGAVRWYFRAREPVQVRAQLFAALAIGNPASHRYALTGAPLAVLRSGAQSTGEFEIAWDARLGGQPAADAVYAMRLHVVDECGHEREFLRFVNVDATPPELQIAAPADQAELRSAAVQVLGSVRDATPDVFEVQVSTLGPTGPWQQLAAGRGNVPQPSALATLQTQGMLGPVWLQLRATDRLGNSAQRVHRITLLPRPDVLASARLAQPLVSPNGDGRLDRLELRLVLLREAQLDVELLNSGGQVLARLLQAQRTGAGPFSLGWGEQHDPQRQPDGRYRLRVRATDAQLGGEPDEAVLEFQIDTEAPVLSWTPQLPAVLSCEQSPALNVADPLLAEYRAELQTAGGAVVRDIAGLTEGSFAFGAFESLQEGAYQVRAMALDLAGNRSETDSRFVLDCSPPQLQLDEPAADAVLARAENVRHRVKGRVGDAHLRGYRLQLVSATDPSIRRELLRSAEPPPPELDLSWSADVGDGDYTLELSADDQAGNASSLTVPVKVDGTPPTARFHAPQAGAAVTATLTLVATATDANLQEWQLLTATPAEAAANAWTVLTRGEQPLSEAALPPVQGLPAGERRFRLLVRDRAGLTAQAELQLLLDDEPPPVPVELSAALEPGGNVRLSWRGGDAPDLAGFNVYRRGGGLPVRLNAEAIAQRQYLDLAVPDGHWAYEVTALDRVGNESAPSNRDAVRVDRTPPTVLITQPAASERVRGVVSVRGTAAGEGDFDRYELTLLDASGQALRVLQQSSSEVRSGVLGLWDSRQAAQGSAVQLRLRAWDRSGNEAAAVQSLEVDNLAPAAPQGLDGQSQAADVELRWLPNQEPDLLGYLLYRNGRLLTGGASLPADLRPLALPQNAYLDPAVPDGTHVYRVYAIDQAGNISPPSAPFQPVIERGPPSAEIIRPGEGTVFDEPLEVLAQTEHLDVAEIAFFVRALGESQWTPLGEPVRAPPWRRVLSTADRPFGEYELQAVATDQGGLSDPQPPRVRVRHQDVTPPPAPDRLSARAEGDRILLSWPASNAADLAHYPVERFDSERGWEEIQRVPAGTLAATDPERALGLHRYRIRAVDATGNLSEPSPDAEAEVFALDFDRLPFSPTAEAQVTVQGRSPRAGQVRLQRELDGSLEDLPGGTVAADLGFALDAALLPGRNRLRLAVVDSQDNRSLAFEFAQTHERPPLAPAGVQGSVDTAGVDLRWQPSAGAIGYRLYRNGSPIRPDVVSSQAITASSEGEAVPEVQDGNAATAWRESTGALSDRLDRRLELSWQGRQLVGGLELEWADAASSARDFDVLGWFDGRWNLLAEVRNQGGASYRLTLESAYPTERLQLVPRRAQWPGAAHALVEARVLTRTPHASTEWSESVADGRHVYTVTAISPLGFESPRSTEWVAVVGDGEAPPAVQLTGVREGRYAQLTWTASEALDLRRYRLLRNGRVLAELPAGTRDYRDANLPNGVHRYRVLAEDLVGNASPPSNEVAIEIAGERPATPVLLRAVPQTDRPALQVHWRPGDGVTPQRYRLFVSFSADAAADPYREIARPEASPWLHTGLAYGQRLYYRIQAEDGAGNLSDLSAPLEAVVRDVRTPASPVITWPALAPAELDWLQPSYIVCGVAEPERRIELRVNDLPAASTQAQAESRALPGIELGGRSISGVALSPDGSRVAWIDSESGRLKQRWLGSDRQEELPLTLRSGLAYSADGASIGGLDGSGTAWKSVNAAGEITEIALLQNTYSAAKLKGSQGWLAAGFHDQQERLWWLRDAASAPVPVDMDERPFIASYVASADGREVFLLTQMGTLYRWALGDAAASAIALQGQGIELRADASGAVLLLEQAQSATRILRVDRPQPKPVVLLPLNATSFAPAADGRGHWVLVDGAVRHYVSSGAVSEQVIPLDANRGASVLLGSKSGTLLAAAPNTNTWVQPVQLAGAWCTDAVYAEAGGNEIVAVAASEAGVRSAPSAALQLNFDATGAQLADLAASASEIRLLPSPGVAGQPHSLLIEMRNAGRRDAADFDVRISIVDPQGRSTFQRRRASLGAQQQSLIAVSLGLLQNGEYRVQVELDSERRIDEISEANNLARTVIRIHPDLAPRLDLTAMAAEQPPGQPFEGRVGVAVAREFAGRLELWITDAAGDRVHTLPALETGPLNALAPWSRPWTWQPAEGVLAGRYRLHARLTDSAGAVRAEQSLDLGLRAAIDFALSLQPARLELTAGESLSVGVGMSVAYANTIVEGGRLTLSAERADGRVETLWSGGTGSLSAGYRLRRSVAWATSGFSPGEVRLRLGFSAPGVEREVSQTLRLVPAAGLSDLFGELALAPAASIALGQPAQLTYRVGNRGSAPLSERGLRVRVTDPASAQTVLADQRRISLSPAQTLSFDLDLSTLPQRPAQYSAVLEAESEQGWRALAQIGLQSNDVEPPSGTLLVPADGQPVRTPAYIEASIRDRHSRVERAEFSLNGGAWRALPGAGERYSSVLSDLPDGDHLLALRAEDPWGNRWQMPPRVVRVDNTPPVIAIQGVADGEHYATPVRPQFSAQDPHLAELLAFDNGVALESGSTVAREGVHRLEVRALDAAGNRAERAVSFVIDLTAPTLAFLSPTSGAQVSTADIRAELQTEAGATIELRAGGWQATVQADAEGRAVFTAVPLQVGENRIEAEARDRAGNRSPRISVQVVRREVGGELLGQLDVPLVDLARGDELPVQTSLRNQRAVAVTGHAVLRVQSAGGALLAERRQPVALQPGAQQTWSERLPTVAWPLGAVGVQLIFDDGSEQSVLASAGVNLLDRTPPQLRVLQPAAGALLASPVALRVEAGDDDALDEVSYRVGTGPWLPIEIAAAPLFEARLSLADGAHTLEVRARDRSGNLTAASPTGIVVDSTPPEIVIEAVADSGLYGEPVRPQVRMLDAHPGVLTVTLNGQPFAPGSLIDRSGRYRLSVQASDQLGQTSQRQIEFDLDLEPVTLQVLSPEEGRILPSTRVTVLGQTKPRARVTAQGPLSSHEVLADASGGFRIDDIGLNPGVNDLALRAVDALGRPSNEVVRRVRVDTSGQQGLTGTLDGDVEIAVGRAWTVRAALRESLGQARQALAVRLLIERSGQSPQELAWSADLAANSAIERVLEPPVQSALGLVGLRLQARLEGAWVDLAQRSLAVVDRTPPELAYVAPEPDSYHRSGIELRARANDVHSAVALVQARIGGGEWTKLQSAPNGVWQGSVQPLDEGRLSIEIRAQDSAQNWTPILSRSVVHDRSPPKIRITGIVDGGLYRERVRVEASASDTSPVDLRLQLNDSPFASGQWVDAHGRYTLSARATDAAGNVSTQRLAFELDLQPPAVKIVTPAAAAIIRSEETPVLGHTEPGADVLLRLNGVDLRQRADANGQFRFDRVPLRIGPNRLQLRATDAAGNVGAWSEVQVERRGGFELRGTLQAPATLNLGAALPVRIQVTNQAAHAQPAVQLRLFARDASGTERAVDARTHSFAAGETLQYEVSASTASWREGVVGLRLLAVDEIEVQVADARVELRGQPGLPPPLPKPRPIPIDEPWGLAWLVLAFLVAARTALRRKERAS